MLLDACAFALNCGARCSSCSLAMKIKGPASRFPCLRILVSLCSHFKRGSLQRLCVVSLLPSSDLLGGGEEWPLCLLSPSALCALRLACARPSSCSRMGFRAGLSTLVLGALPFPLFGGLAVLWGGGVPVSTCSFSERMGEVHGNDEKKNVRKCCEGMRGIMSNYGQVQSDIPLIPEQSNGGKHVKRFYGALHTTKSVLRGVQFTRRQANAR